MGYIERNPLFGMEKPPGGKRDFIISPELYNQIIDRCHDQQFHDLCIWSWETGARPEETLKAEARHLDTANSRMVFAKDEAKGKRRTRVVYLTDEALEMASRLAREHPVGHLFRNSKGDPWHRNNVNCRFGRMKKHIHVKLCLYHFRHTFANRLLEAGVDSLTVAILLGHADPSMLGRVYQHLSFNPDHLLQQLKRA